MVIDYQK